MKDYSDDLVISRKILAGDTVEWQRCIEYVLKHLGSWNHGPCDCEDIVNNSILKAGRTFKPKRSFNSHALQVARCALADQWDSLKKNNKFWVQAKVSYNLYNDSSNPLDALIAKEEKDELGNCERK